MNARILHWSPDDKFIPLQEDLFEVAFPGQNQYRIKTSPGATRRHTQPSSHLEFVDAHYFESPAARRDLESHDVLICHGITQAFARGFELIPDSTTVVWSAWGYEYYTLLEDRFGTVLLPRTQDLVTSMDRARRRHRLGSMSGWRELASNIGRRASRRAGREQPPPLMKVAHRLDVMSVNVGDVPRLREVLPDLRAVNHLVPYYTTTDTLDSGPARMEGPDILLGNSASVTNNHADAFETLRKIDLSGRRVVTPLSYPHDDYADRIEALGHEMLGDAFAPLREFMPLDAFHREISTCGTVVMNHVRQQAVGTISSALYKHARVYLRPESPLSGFFDGLGATIYSVDELAVLERDGTGQAESIGDDNSRIIGEFWSRERAISSIRELTRQPRLADDT